MREIGGYIELDTYTGSEYHEKALALNCGRNCLVYLIKTKNIKKIYIPKFLCASVADVCKKEGIQYEYYSIDYGFHPIFEKFLCGSEWIYIVNYYGQIDHKEIEKYKELYGQIIIDNAQAFFEKQIEGIDTLYTCRKYFGVADGAYLYTDAKKLELEVMDLSFNRMNFILGRYEKDANSFYREYVNNNNYFDDQPIKQMSKLTHNLLRAIDYESVAKVRTVNFEYLNQCFRNLNKLKLQVPYGAFMYPLLVDNADIIRKVLQKEGIYIPILWPDVFHTCKRDELEYKLAESILPLPVDQRYNIEDMQYVAERVIECID